MNYLSIYSLISYFVGYKLSNIVMMEEPIIFYEKICKGHEMMLSFLKYYVVDYNYDSSMNHSINKVCGQWSLTVYGY